MNLLKPLRKVTDEKMIYFLSTVSWHLDLLG